MNICFICNNTDISLGSYRIWINDLNEYFNRIGIESKINPNSIDEYDIHIYQKGYYNIKNKKKINGIINPDTIEIIKDFNFLIVGSIEEKESLIKLNKNIFIFPLIEKMFLNIKPKIHIDKNTEIIIGYHGNPNHLNHLDIGLKDALERLDKEFNIKFMYITSDKKRWEKGRPKIKKKKYCKWEINDIKNNISKFDIGVVPNISEYYNEKDLDENKNEGLYNNDIKVRFKNKSNNGRLLVLAQFGIPIVADITPSNMHILGDPDNGFAVLSNEGWYKSIKDLIIDYKLRNKVSKNAYNEIKRLYDPYEWAKKLYSNIITIKK